MPVSGQPVCAGAQDCHLCSSQLALLEGVLCLLGLCEYIRICRPFCLLCVVSLQLSLGWFRSSSSPIGPGAKHQLTTDMSAGYMKHSMSSQLYMLLLHMMHNAECASFSRDWL